MEGFVERLGFAPDRQGSYVTVCGRDNDCHNPKTKMSLRFKSVTVRITSAIANFANPTPFLVIDQERVAENFRSFSNEFRNVQVFYAVKANPHPVVLTRLVSEGAHFDCASLNEILLVLDAGGNADKISFGTTIKKSSDIAKAYQLGVRYFAYDSLEELNKIASNAPASNVICRILVNGSGEGSQWPLSRKFGCDDSMAIELLTKAKNRGLKPRGVSFHVGSQQLDVSAWDKAIAQAKQIFDMLACSSILLDTINLGGGFPTDFENGSSPKLHLYAEAIGASLQKHFGDITPQLIAEPGRAIVGDAGLIVAEVVLTARKSKTDKYRWVFLDIGRFNGLAETEGEAIRYKFSVPGQENAFCEKAIIAGPTCDSVDTLYERNPVEMPVNLRAGDKVWIHSTGAYTSTYSSIGFNGFAPLEVFSVEEINSAKYPVLRAS